ncbi:MAG: ABC transporter substrate-binding protein [Acidimicrobiia bacterium]|nr:ABC transporter substrate-binding protein [Acidimicrobiia bacterium]
MKRNIDGHLASPLTSNPLRGLRSPELVDERTLVLRTDFPWSTLPIYFAGQPGWMAAPSQLDAPDGAPQEPVGTGPFVLERRVLDQETTVVRNEDYWREGLPNLDRVTFRVVPDNQVRNQALRSGEIDTSSTFRDEDIVQFREDEGVTMLEDTVDGEEVFVLLNTKEPPLDDLRVRRAIAHATDTEEYVELLGSGILEPAESPWDPGSPWHTEVDYPQHDPARARELVEEYEADTGEEVRFEMSVPPVPEYQEAMELLQDQWKDAGIEVDLRTVEFTQHILEAATGSFQAKLWRQFGSDDPDGEAVWWLSTNAQPPLATNFARNEDPRIDEALMAARATADVEVRRARYADVARYLTEDLPYIWIYHVTWATILDSDVKGVGDLTAPDGAPRQPMSGGVMPVAALWLDR